MRKFISNLSQTSIRGGLALVTVVFVFSWLTILIFHEIPDRNKDIVNTLGSLVIGACFGSIFGYYYGASKDKTDSDKQDKMTITNPNITASVTAPNTNDTAATK
jgi:hypothetical protein